mgnify:CR=1 FL=1
MNFNQTICDKLKTNDYRLVVGEYLDASVFILLTAEPNPKIGLVKRSKDVSLHPGEIALPGGMYDKSDSSLIDTAYRETYEEVFISKNDIQLLGKMGHYLTSTNIRVTPYIGFINPSNTPTPASREIDKVYMVPISKLIEQSYSGNQEIHINDKKNLTEYFVFEDITIWGVTGRIICEFLNKCYDTNYQIKNLPDGMLS